MSNQEKTIKIWVDGGSSGNPGKGAIAFLIIGNDFTRIYANFLKNKTTNNEAEYLALIRALISLLNFKIDFSDYHLIIHSDSQLVVNQVKGLWFINEEKFVKWVKKIRKMLSCFKSWEIKWIPKEENKICDNQIKALLYYKKTIK